MEGSALEKAQGPAGIVHIPTQDEHLIKDVVQHAQQIVPSHTTEQATPPAAHPIPDSDALKQAGAERVGVEPPFSLGDVSHMIGTAGTLWGGEEPSTHVRTTPGSRVLSWMKERAGKLFRRRMQPVQKAT